MIHGWGEAGWERRWLDGSKEWTTEWSLLEPAHHEDPIDFVPHVVTILEQALDDMVNTTRVRQLILD